MFWECSPKPLPSTLKCHKRLEVPCQAGAGLCNKHLLCEGESCPDVQLKWQSYSSIFKKKKLISNSNILQSVFEKPCFCGRKRLSLCGKEAKSEKKKIVVRFPQLIVDMASVSRGHNNGKLVNNRNVMATWLALNFHLPHQWTHLTQKNNTHNCLSTFFHFLNHCQHASGNMCF